MTALLGGSLVLIALSSLALVMGWIGQSQWLIFTSIAASVFAALMLALAYDRSKTDPLERRGRSTGSDNPTRGSRAARMVAVQVEGGGTLAGGLARPLLSVSSRPVTPDLSAPHVAKPARAGGDPDVVGDVERRKYHRPACRFARSEALERMPRSIARRRAYDACRLCRP